MLHILSVLQAHTQNFILKHYPSTRHGRYMHKIHNTHLGENCFIIGNGPSLTAEDLTALHKEGIATFAVNRIFKIFPLTPWRPTYYVNSDHVLIRDVLEDVNKLTESEKFIPLQDKYYHNSKVTGAHYFFRNDHRDQDPADGFSLDCTKQVNTRGTVTIECMQLAMHMGYRHIYLIGVDHNFDKVITENGEVIIDPSVKNYFIEGYDTDVANEVVHDLGTTTKAYMDVKKFIDKHDVHIYNASRQTKLEVFPKVTFEEALRDIKERNANG